MQDSAWIVQYNGAWETKRKEFKTEQEALDWARDNEVIDRATIYPRVTFPVGASSPRN